MEEGYCPVVEYNSNYENNDSLLHSDDVKLFNMVETTVTSPDDENAQSSMSGVDETHQPTICLDDEQTESEAHKKGESDVKDAVYNNEDVKPNIQSADQPGFYPDESVFFPFPNALVGQESSGPCLLNYPFYGCAVCNISYLTLSDLDHHVVIHKDRITSWDLRQLSQKRKKHLHKVSKDKVMKLERDYKISQEKYSKANIDLEKIFKCGVCAKQFALSYYLKLHVRSHTGEKPYQCSQCGLSFITASKLGRHIKQHSDAKYECRICHKEFTRFEYLKNHFDRKHAMDKLEGEPYDFNAILPYLKDLERELEEKSKAKSENLWPDDFWGDNPNNETENSETANDVIKLENVPPEETAIENIDIKTDDWDPGDLNCDKDDKNWEDGIGVVKKEELSGEDYFPMDNPDNSDNSVEPPTAKRRKSNSFKDDVIEPFDGDPDGDPLKCRICEKIIKTPSYLRIHMRTHTGEKPYACYICKKSFITASKLNRHVLTHETSSKCNDEFNESWKPEEVTVKMEMGQTDEEGSHDNKTQINETTKEADGKHPKKRLLRKKLSANVGGAKNKRRRKRPYACDYCQKKFLHLETLRVHRRSHIGELKKIICHFCVMEFPDEGTLQVHLISHTGPEPYVCTMCNKKYKGKASLIYHRRMHNEDNKYICDICSKSFNAAFKLKKHLHSHRPNKFITRYECPVCAHMFNTKYHIEMHLGTHEKEGLILEENRGQVLAMVLQNVRKIPIQNDDNLMNMIKDNPDERSRICNICGEIFDHFFFLEQHLKTHGSTMDTLENGNTEVLANTSLKNENDTEQNKYVCQVCQKAFKLHYYLKLHSFTHTKEKPFKCQQCGKGFITKGKLKRHVESHTGLKKYQCHICHKYFTRPSYLRIHIRAHNNRIHEHALKTSYLLQ